MLSSIEQTSHRYLDEVTDDTDDEELLTEEDEIIGEEYAILAWLRSFPQISQNKETLSKDWSQNEIVSRALLNVGAEIFDIRNTALDDIEASQHWEMIGEWVCNHSKDHYEKEARLFILIRLLCHAVANECSRRGAYISRIMNLDKGVQRTLMQLIETGGSKKVNDEKDFNNDLDVTHNNTDETYLDDLDIENDNESLLDDDEKDFLPPSTDKENIQNHQTSTSFLSPLVTRQVGIKSNSTPRFIGSIQKRSIFTPLSPHNLSRMKMEKLEKETKDVRSTNNHLSKELEAMQKQEQTLLTKLNKIEAEHRADRLGVEATALARVNELNDEYTRKMSLLEKEVLVCNESVAEATSTKEELAILQDEVDVLRHSNDKLVQTEEHLSRLKLKIEEMGEVAEALHREEKAHSASVSKCIQIENDLALLQPLRRQLDEYKSRAVDAEVRLIEYEDDIKNLKVKSEKLSVSNKDLQDRSLRQQTEKEGLRRQVEQNGAHINQKEGNALGVGMSELNPVVKEELLRLRSENKRLGAFAAKRNEDSVQKMEEHVEDSERLATKFQEQYFSTKSGLADTKEQLKESLQREVILKQKVFDSDESVKKLTLTLKEERKGHHKALLNSRKAHQSMKRSIIDKCREEKDSLERKWETKCTEQHQVAQTGKADLQQKMRQKEESSVQIIAKLQEENSSAMVKYKQSSLATIDGLEIDHKAQVSELAKNYTRERNELMQRGKAFVEKEKLNAQAKNDVMEKKCVERINNISQELQKCRQLYKENGEKAMFKIQSYRQKNRIAQATESEMLRDRDLMQDKHKKLEKEKVKLHDENERYRRQIGGRFGSDSNFRIQHEELEQEYNIILEENRSLKKHANTKITCMGANNESAQTTSQDILDVETSLSYDAGLSVANSSITQLRAEYEERIEKIVDEKRELIMKNSAARTDVQKVEIRAYELEMSVQKLESEKTSLQLQLERSKLIQVDSFSPMASGKRLASKVSPTAIASKAQEIWKSSKISNATSPSTSTEQETIDERLNDGGPISPSKFSILPRVEVSSPIFKMSVNKFKQKLHLKLSAKKEKKTSVDRRSRKNFSPKVPMSLMQQTSVSGTSEGEDLNTAECTQS